jgi:DNA-binding YbaB/EbfC family protein
MAKMGKFPGMPGMNMGNLMKQAQKMQQDMAALQEELKTREYTATAGGGAVTAVVNGENRIVSLDISPDALDSADAELLADMVMVAVNEALRQAAETAEKEMGKLTGGLCGLF